MWQSSNVLISVVGKASADRRYHGCQWEVLCRVLDSTLWGKCHLISRRSVVVVVVVAVVVVVVMYAVGQWEAAAWPKVSPNQQAFSCSSWCSSSSYSSRLEWSYFVYGLVTTKKISVANFVEVNHQLVANYDKKLLCIGGLASIFCHYCVLE